MDVRAVMMVAVLGWAGCGQPFALSTGAGGAGTGAATATGTASSASGTMASGTASSTATGSMAMTCTWVANGNPCNQGDYCQPTALGCGNGTCVPIPTAQHYQSVPVCGCDGVTYWNTAIANSFSMAVKTNAVCGVTDGLNLCMSSGQCPPGRDCAHKVSDCTTPFNTGVCVGLPNDCGKTMGVATLCESMQCDSVCNQIKQDKNYMEVASCN